MEKVKHHFNLAGILNTMIVSEWLDAQVKTKNRRMTHNPIKHIIEKWSGRYVSQSDVEVAA